MGVPPGRGPPPGTMQWRRGWNEQELRPGVQDGGDGDLGTQAAEGDLRQGLGDRGEEQGVRHLGGGEEEGVQLGGGR